MLVDQSQKARPVCGGNSNNGAKDGAFNCNLNNTVSNSNWNIGAMLRSCYPVCAVSCDMAPIGSRSFLMLFIILTSWSKLAPRE